MERRAVSVLVVDDLAACRRAVTSVIGAAEGFVLAGEAASGEQAIALLEQRPVGLVLMDVNLPGISGIQAAEQIGRRFPNVMVILLSVCKAEDLPETAMLSGTQFCPKDQFGPDELEVMWKRRKLRRS